MRIAFIAGCLEPGRDGVGDHVRRLATECERAGHVCRLLSISEPGPVRAGPGDGNVLRLEAREHAANGWRAARSWLDAFAPEWVSLHFVPYSFDPRGFFGSAIPGLRGLGESAPRRHIFFHEIWIALGRQAPWRQRLAGAWQRRAVKRLLREFSPAGVHTSIGYYRAAFATLARRAHVLPLFGNVPPAGAAVTPANLPGVDPGALVCGLFGAVHSDWEPGALLRDFAAMAAAEGRSAAVVSVGAMRSGAARFQQLADEWRGRVQCVALGERSEAELPGVFRRFDFAASTMPWWMIGKSSSAASLREHGLRVVVTREGERPRFAATSADLEPADEGFIPYFRAPARLAEARRKTPPRSGVAAYAKQFLADLKTWETPPQSSER